MAGACSLFKALLGIDVTALFWVRVHLLQWLLQRQQVSETPVIPREYIKISRFTTAPGISDLWEAAMGVCVLYQFLFS